MPPDVACQEPCVLTKQNSFTDHNYQTFFNMTLEMFVRPWEKLVMSMKFSEVRPVPPEFYL